jgi:hypothetical protein
MLWVNFIFSRAILWHPPSLHGVVATILIQLATERGNTRKAMASGFYDHACLVGDLEGANATVFRYQDMPANIVLGSVKDEARAECLAGVTFLGNVISGEWAPVLICYGCHRHFFTLNPFLITERAILLPSFKKRSIYPKIEFHPCDG